MRACAGRALLGILICSWLCIAGATVAGAEPRVALVIGNSDYGGDLGRLPNPVNDAKLMAETLRKVGFEVVEVEDADQGALKQAIVDFESEKWLGQAAAAQQTHALSPDILAYAAAEALLAKMARE